MHRVQLSLFWMFVPCWVRAATSLFQAVFHRDDVVLCYHCKISWQISLKKFPVPSSGQTLFSEDLCSCFRKQSLAEIWFSRYMDLTDNYSILFPPHLQLLVTIQHLKLSAKTLVTGHNSIWQMLHWIIWNHLHNSLSLSARLFPDVAEEYLHVVFRAMWAAKHVESGNVWNCSECVVPYNFCQVCASSETPYPGQFPTLSQLNLWCKLDIVGQKICPIQCKWFINHW